jgi:hypothetical protein
MGFGRLAAKVGVQMQKKVANEVKKYDKPVKLKLLTNKEIKQMKS